MNDDNVLEIIEGVPAMGYGSLGLAAYPDTAYPIAVGVTRLRVLDLDEKYARLTASMQRGVTPLLRYKHPVTFETVELPITTLRKTEFSDGQPVLDLSVII